VDGGIVDQPTWRGAAQIEHADLERVVAPVADGGGQDRKERQNAEPVLPAANAGGKRQRADEYRPKLRAQDRIFFAAEQQGVAETADQRTDRTAHSSEQKKLQREQKVSCRLHGKQSAVRADLIRE